MLIINSLNGKEYDIPEIIDIEIEEGVLGRIHRIVTLGEHTDTGSFLHPTFSMGHTTRHPFRTRSSKMYVKDFETYVRLFHSTEKIAKPITKTTKAITHSDIISIKKVYSSSKREQYRAPKKANKTTRKTRGQLVTRDNLNIGGIQFVDISKQSYSFIDFNTEPIEKSIIGYLFTLTNSRSLLVIKDKEGNMFQTGITDKNKHRWILDTSNIDLVNSKEWLDALLFCCKAKILKINDSIKL